MTHAAKILADSLSPDGVRLTTFEITFPRIVLAESGAGSSTASSFQARLTF